MRLQLQRPIAFIDLETTGINISTDKIIEIAIVKILPDGSKVTKRKLLNPQMPIPESSTAVHGITDEMVKDAPTFKQVANELRQFLDNCDLGGYNSNRFDIPMLIEEFMRTGLDFSTEGRKMVDVQKIFHLMEQRTLSAAYRFYCDKCLEERILVPLLAVDDVIDDAAQKSDVRSGAHRSVNIGDGAGAGEARIDVNDLGAVFDLGLHRPAEGDGMVLRHVGAHDDDAVGVGHAPGVERCSAAAESCPQTGDARAVSYPRLVLDGDYPQAAHELLVHMVELNLEGGAAEGEDGGRHVDNPAVGKLLDEGLVARLLY